MTATPSEMDRLRRPLVFPGGATMPGRIALAPLTNRQSHADGLLSDEEISWLGLRADGGFALIETAAAYVGQDGKGWEGELGIDRDECHPGLSRLAQRIAVRGAITLVQIFHGGARAPSRITNTRPWSASEFHEASPQFEVPRAADEADIARVIGQFASAAVRARIAGFSGVEIHGAHGYLPSQFLSQAMNARTDRWGGDLVGRARLLREITKAVRAATPRPALVGVRLSPEDYGFARGLDLDETVQVCRWLIDDGIDFVHLSLWDAAAMTRKHPDVHPLTLFRAVVPPTVPVIVAGGVWTPADAVACLDRGADAVALGRAGILNPAWPQRAQDAGWSPRRPPMSAQELGERAVSPVFVDYLRRWPNFVG